MKIAYIVPGSGGGFYCENCVRDGVLISAMRRAGHDAFLVPMYLPLFLDESGAIPSAPLFFGGINAYLQQISAFFRRTPRWLDRGFDSHWLLRLAARRAGTTRAYGLGAMTYSMLLGREGRQAKEVERLVAWLRSVGAPEIVHLSNALLLGLAAPVRRELGCRVVCSLQDEDTWLDALDPPYDRDCWQALRAGAKEVAVFVAVSRWYADRFAARLDISPASIRIVPAGVPDPGEPALRPGGGAVIGYLARLSRANGADQLVEAFLRLRQQRGFETARLRLTGGHTADDRPFLRQLHQRIAAAGATNAVDFLPDFDRRARREFLATLTALSVPMPAGEAFGLFLVEAAAAGVPVVQPRTGAFPEIVAATGGGALYEPATADALYAALLELLSNPDQWRDLAVRGRQGYLREFTDDLMARATVAAYDAAAKSRSAV